MYETLKQNGKSVSANADLQLAFVTVKQKVEFLLNENSRGEPAATVADKKLQELSVQNPAQVGKCLVDKFCSLTDAQQVKDFYYQTEKYIGPSIKLTAESVSQAIASPDTPELQRRLLIKLAGQSANSDLVKPLVECFSRPEITDDRTMTALGTAITNLGESKALIQLVKKGDLSIEKQSMAITSLCSGEKAQEFPALKSMLIGILNKEQQSPGSLTNQELILKGSICAALFDSRDKNVSDLSKELLNDSKQSKLWPLAANQLAVAGAHLDEVTKFYKQASTSEKTWFIENVAGSSNPELKALFVAALKDCPATKSTTEALIKGFDAIGANEMLAKIYETHIKPNGLEGQLVKAIASDEVLMKSSQNGLLPIVRSIASDPQKPQFVREDAVKVLATQKDAEGLRQVCRQLEPTSNGGSLVETTLKGLLGIPENASKDILLSAVNSKSVSLDTRADIARALLQLGEPRGVVPVFSSLSDDNLYFDARRRQMISDAYMDPKTRGLLLDGIKLCADGADPDTAQRARVFLHQAEMCEKVGIQNPMRFSSATLRSLIDERLLSKVDSSPIAVVVAAQADDVGVLNTQENVITDLQKNGYRVRYYETPKDTGFIDCIKDAASYSQGGKASALVLAGHGSPTSIAFSTDNGPGLLTVSDIRQAGDINLSPYLEQNGKVILLSCSTGAQPIADNMTAAIRSAFPDHNGPLVYAPKADTTGVELAFNEKNKLASASFSTQDNAGTLVR